MEKKPDDGLEEAVELKKKKHNCTCCKCHTHKKEPLKDDIDNYPTPDKAPH